MAYDEITDPEIAPEAPISSELYYKLRDNPEGIADADTGAPKMNQGTLEIIAGDIQTSRRGDLRTISSTTYIIAIGNSIVCPSLLGSIRIRFALRLTNAGGGVYGQLYFNGSIISPEYYLNTVETQYYTFDFTMTEPGVIDLYSKIDSDTRQAGYMTINSLGTPMFSREL